MEYNLKPCPLCGAMARAWEWNSGARVECSKWNSTDGNEHYVGVGAKTLKEAVEKWNERLKEGEDAETM